MVNKKLLTVLIPCKAPYPVINRNDIRIKAVDQQIKRIKRGDGSAGRNININSECCNGISGMIFGVGMNSNMTFIKMSCNGFLFLCNKPAPCIA